MKNTTERKIHNFNSEILIEKTIKEEGFDPSSKGYQKNHVWATCRFCGKPHRIYGANMTKSGSACHKECRIQEQKILGSSFNNEEIRKKAQKNKTNRYSQEEINKKISRARKKSQSKIENTNIIKYGVKNPFQSDEIKDKIKKTHKKKYGHEHPMQNPEIKEKQKNTNINKYGVENPMQNDNIRNKSKKSFKDKTGYDYPMQNPEIKEKALNKFQDTVSKDKDYYKLINILREDDFWNELKKNDKTLKEVCDYFDINYKSVTSRLLHPEFKDKYYKVYNFPKQQQQKDMIKKIEKWGANIEVNTRKVIPPLELDLYVPDKNLAIEYNGSYWHSEAVLDPKKSNQFHINKTNLCKKKGIRLIHIFEHTYARKQEQVLGYLKSALGLNKIKVPARKCKITYDDASKFMDKYHIQGKGFGTKAYVNLEYDGSIIGSMSAGQHHEKGGDNAACVLNRLCFKEDVTVQGGASKMFKYFVKWAKENGYTKIISWSDNCISEGLVYKKLGFKLEDEHAPGYFYFDSHNKKYVTRQSRRKSNKERPEGMTIREWNRSKGFYPIWDCGKKKWIYKIN